MIVLGVGLAIGWPIVGPIIMRQRVYPLTGFLYPERDPDRQGLVPGSHPTPKSFKIHS